VHTRWERMRRKKAKGSGDGRGAGQRWGRTPSRSYSDLSCASPSGCSTPSAVAAAADDDQGADSCCASTHSRCVAEPRILRLGCCLG
jgi:hypothetical protein